MIKKYIIFTSTIFVGLSINPYTIKSSTYLNIYWIQQKKNIYSALGEAQASQLSYVAPKLNIKAILHNLINNKKRSFVLTNILDIFLKLFSFVDESFNNYKIF